MGRSAPTFRTGSGIYLVLVAVMSSAIGGYLAARLRTKWTGLHTNEVFFRDTAHGFIAWAFATVLGATVLGAAARHVVSGTAAGIGPATTAAAQNSSPSQVYVDRLFRADLATPAAAPGTATGGSNASGNELPRTEANRLWMFGFREGSDLAPADRVYLARLVASKPE